MDTWPPAWCGTEAVERNEAAIQQKKEEAKRVAQQKRNEQFAAEV